jgi:hypothetical protein
LRPFLVGRSGLAISASALARPMPYVRAETLRLTKAADPGAELMETGLYGPLR